MDNEVKRYVEELRASDKEFDEGVRAMEEDTKFMDVFETGGLLGTPGMVRPPVTAQGRLHPGDVDTKLSIISIQFDWSHIEPMNAYLQKNGLSGGPITRQMVVGHEVYVHAIPFCRSGGAAPCLDVPHSDPNTCGRRRHNELGAQIGWSTRDGW